MSMDFDNELEAEEDMNFEDIPLPRSPSSAARSAAAKSAERKARSASAKAKAKPASRKGNSFKGSPGQASGNFIVNPETGNVIQVRRLDRKTDTWKYNSIYSELINTLGQDQVNGLKRYSTKEAASEVATALRDERKAAGVGRNGATKTTVYYFNKVTHHVGTKVKAGESHSEAFATKLEAQMWGYTHGLDAKGNVVAAAAGTGFLKKKPVENPTGKLGTRPGDELIRYTLTVKVVNGRQTNTFKEWTKKDGKASAHQVSYRQALSDAGVAFKQPRLYNVAERLAMADVKSSAAKAKNSSTKTNADVDQAAADARKRPNVKAESISKILNNPKLKTPGMKVSALNLLGRGGSGGPGVYMTKRQVVNGVSTKVPGARANMMWTEEGTLKAKATEFVKWYQGVSGKTGKAPSKMTDAEIIATLEKAVGEGWLVRTEKV